MIRNIRRWSGRGMALAAMLTLVLNFLLLALPPVDVYAAPPQNIAVPNQDYEVDSSSGAPATVQCSLRFGTINKGDVPSTPQGVFENNPTGDMGTLDGIGLAWMAFNDASAEYDMTEMQTQWEMLEEAQGDRDNYHYVVGVGDGSYQSNRDCAQALFFVQWPGQDFYLGDGIKQGSQFCAPVIAFEAGQSAGSITGGLSHSSGGNINCSSPQGSTDMRVALPPGTQVSTYLPNSNGGGAGAGAGGTPTPTNMTFEWEDITQINRVSGGTVVETYKLTPNEWSGHQNRELLYMLTMSTVNDENGQPRENLRSLGGACTPRMVLSTDGNGFGDVDFNYDGGDDFDDFTDDLIALFNKTNLRGDFRDRIQDGTNCTNQNTDDVPIGTNHRKRLWFNFYPGTKEARLVFDQAASNEQPYLVAYTLQEDNRTFTAPPCTDHPSALILDEPLAGPYDGSRAVEATWRISDTEVCTSTGWTYAELDVMVRMMREDATPPLTTSLDPEGEEDVSSCEGTSGVLGWILCPIAELLDGVLGYLDNQIEIKLLVREEYYRNEDLRQAWAVVRNIAYAILVPIMLVMVIGTALGIEIFSAYTIKKALPRMVIAVIFITLSWYICAFLVEFFNVMGAGIRGLVTNPFGISQEGGAIQTAIANANLSNSGHSGVWGGLSDTRDTLIVGVVAVGGTIAFMYLAAAMLMSMLGTAVLVLGIALIILLARQMFIIAAILLAPLAILSWIFPGNDKLWKLWWNMFSKLLMIFPMIMLLIGLGQIFGKLAGDIGGDSDNLIRAITVIGAVIIPYAAIPFTFKWAGGVFGNLAGMVNDKNKGMLDRLKKGRAEKRGQAWNSFKSGTGTGFGQKNALARGLGTRIGAGAGGGKGVYGFGAKGKARMDQMNRENAVSQVMKNPAWNGVNQDDNALHAGILLQDMDKKAAIAALTDPNGEHRLEAAEAERAVAAWQASGLGGRAAAIAAAQQLVSTGTGYRNLQHMTRTLARAAGGNTSTATALAGFANSETKRAGRHDLAPGFDTANRLTRSWMDGRGGLSDLSTVSQADWDGAHGRAWRSGSLYEHANDKPANLENHIGHFQRQLQESLANGDEAGRDEALVFFEELRAMKPNAKGENSAIINRTLNGSGDAGNPSAGDLVEQAYASMATTSETTEEVDTGIVDPSTGQTIRRTQTNTTSDGGAAARQRILGQSRSYERPDQNRLADPGAPTPQPRP